MTPPPSSSTPSSISLPVVEEQRIRRSRVGKWRAAVLILIHVVAAIRIAHWLAGNETMTPLEPSEAMEFSKNSVINAGFIFFGLAILSTLVLGRWFCGWACHLVALQDLCRYLLGKIGMRPKPARLGILGLVPFMAFLYMFIAPIIFRLVDGRGLAEPTLHLMTENFWATFPSWIPAILTFAVCGFVAVYLLGSKGFCTYGCPYGGIFGVADQLAPFRIRVNDDCDGSGHCTAVCSSNVRVHEEVRDFGMVVDPGCMKCMDCVSVCPNDALSVGFGMPAMLASRRTPAPENKPSGSGLSWLPLWLLIGGFSMVGYSIMMWPDRNASLTMSTILTAIMLVVAFVFRGKSRRVREAGLAEQTFLAVAFLLCLHAFRGLYGLVPFLFALCLAGVLSFLLLSCLRMVYRRDLSLHGLQIKRAGRIRIAGAGLIALMTLFTALGVHSGILQYHNLRGRALVWSMDPAKPADPETIERARRHYTIARKMSFMTDARHAVGLAVLARAAGDLEGYGKYLAEAAEEAPRNSLVTKDLADHYAAMGQLEESLAMLEETARRDPRFPGLVDAISAVAQGFLRRNPSQPELARQAYERALEIDATSAPTHYDLGYLETLLGNVEAARDRYQQALDLDPQFLAARENLAGCLCQLGIFDQCADHFEEALRQKPDVQTHLLAASAYAAMGRLEDAQRHVQSALQMDPQNVNAQQALTQLQQAAAGTSGSAQAIIDEVRGNMMGQLAGEVPLASYNLPKSLVDRAVDRVVRESYRNRFRLVHPPEAAQPDTPGSGEPSPSGGVRIADPDYGVALRLFRGTRLETRPADRGYIAPILDRSSLQPVPPDQKNDPAARRVAERLAFDGLLATTVDVLSTLDRETLSTIDVDQWLRKIGIPTDWLSAFSIDGERVVDRIVRAMTEDVTAEDLVTLLGRSRFQFEPTHGGFAVATESGEHDPQLVRVQLTRGTYWRAPGAGGCLDLVRQLSEVLPEVPMLASIERRHLEDVLPIANSWASTRTSPLTIVPEPLVVAQWAQDNGKAGVLEGEPATLLPRFASRNEDGSVFVPGESFLADGLAAAEHRVLHSPLLFQGGNLLAVADPARQQRVLLVGEAEVARNTAMGLTQEQVLEAFRIEFAVDRCLVLPAVSFHIDYDVTFRNDGQQLIAFVNDTQAAVRLIIERGLDGLVAGGRLDPGIADRAREHLVRGEDPGFYGLVQNAVYGNQDAMGRFPMDLAQHFTTAPTDSPESNFRRFLVAMDIFFANSAPWSSSNLDGFVNAYLGSLVRRLQDEEELRNLLETQGWRVVGIPSLSDAAFSVNTTNGIHGPDFYLMPAHGGFYAHLDEAAADAFASVLGSNVSIHRIFTAESQRRVGAVHCSVVAYPKLP